MPEISPAEAHHRAVFNKGITSSERLVLLNVAVDGYKSEFDMARALRDRGKEKYKVSDGSWTDDLARSIDHFESEYSMQRRIEQTWPGEDTTEARRIVQREMGASACMYGRLLLDEQLRSDGPVDASAAFSQLISGMQELFSSRGSDLPDQYEINFAAITAIAEAYQGFDPMNALRGAGHSAYLACISESPTRVAYPNPEATTAYRLKTRTRSLARAGMAGFVAAAPYPIRQSMPVRRAVAAVI